MPLQRKKRKPLLLSSTRPRPPSYSHNPDGPSTILSSSHTRTLIRQHHVLQKRLATARAAQNQPLASALEVQIAASGGLALYQRASLAGQAKTRGGDSSGVLVRWLREMMMMADGKRGGENRKCEWRMLEVGALRVDNAAARSGLFSTVERIDLHAQAKGIVTQDFMERPLPAPGEEGFDVVSLSLVLNYVGEAGARGEMLRRVEGFLRKRKRRRGRDDDDDDDMGENAQWGMDGKDGCFPGLFLVLPAPCVTNSRYLDEERLEAMMRWLGYTMARRKMSLKLVYYLWKWEGRGAGEEEGKGEAQPERRRTDSGTQHDEEEDNHARTYNEAKNHPHPQPRPHQPPPNSNSNSKKNPSTQSQSQPQSQSQTHTQTPAPHHDKNKNKRASRSQPQPQQSQWSSKREIRKGRARNNFAVVLK